MPFVANSKSLDQTFVHINSLKSLENLHKNSYRDLVGFASLFVSNRHIAEELVQDVFTESVARSLSNDKLVFSNPEAFIKQAIVNKSRSFHRRNFLKVVKEEKATRDFVASTTTSDFSSERHEQIDHAIERLPSAQRECIILRFYEDMKVSEIATTLNIAEGTVKSHLNRAAKSIKETLGQPKAKDAK